METLARARPLLVIGLARLITRIPRLAIRHLLIIGIPLTTRIALTAAPLFLIPLLARWSLRARLAARRALWPIIGPASRSALCLRHARRQRGPRRAIMLDVAIDIERHQDNQRHENDHIRAVKVGSKLLELVPQLVAGEGQQQTPGQ